MASPKLERGVSRLISTKFQPPTDTGHLLVRSRLLDRLNESAECRLTVIHAPAGFGKTSIAIQWRKNLIDAGANVAWLSVDDEDNEKERCLTYLIEAIRLVQSGVTPDAVSALESKSKSAAQYVATDLVNDIAHCKEEIYLVLDDWHLIRNQAIHQWLTFVLERMSANFHLVICSRTQPPLPLATLRVQNQLNEVGSDDLRFSEDESSVFLRELNHLAITNEDVRSLVHTTEGWVAALQLAVYSLRSTEEFGRLIDEFSGKHHLIGEYLAENVLDNLQKDTLEFLLKTSILDRLCAPLCDQVSGQANSQLILERLEKQDMFIRPLDSDMQWFRYHHLFAGFLRRRLKRDYLEEVPKLHRIASNWFSENGQTEEAVQHSLASGDVEQAIKLVERDAMLLVEHSSMATLLGLVNRLPLDQIENRGGLQLAVAWANCLTHHPEAAQHSLDNVERYLVDFDTAENKAILAEARVLQGCINIYADQLNGVDELVSPCLEDANELSPWIVAVAANVLTYVHIHSNRYVEAVRLQEWTNRFHSLNRGPFSTIYGRCFAGMADLAQGRLVEAEEKFSTALNVAYERAGRHSHAARLASALLGRVLYERDEVTRAAQLLEESRILGVEGGVADFSIASYIFSSRLKLLQGKADEAKIVLVEGANTARTLQIKRLAFRVESERIRLSLLDCDWPTTEQILVKLDEAYPVVETGRTGIEQEIEVVRQAARARVLAAKGQLEEARLLLEPVVDEARVSGRRYEEIELRVQLAHVLESAGLKSEAEEILLPAVIFGDTQGMVRTFLDESPQVVTVLRRLLERFRLGTLPRATPPTVAHSLRTIVDAAKLQYGLDEVWSSQWQDSASTGVTMPEMYKERELEILRLLEMGKSNKEIARDTDISVDTVKWYLKTLYSKLDVNSRTQAVSRARHLGLLS